VEEVVKKNLIKKFKLNNKKIKINHPTKKENSEKRRG